MNVWRLFGSINLDEGPAKRALQESERAADRAATGMKRSIDGSAAAIDRRLTQLGTSMQRVGRDLSLRVTAPIVAFGTATLVAAGNFEQGMNRVAALSGATGDQLDQLTLKARELGSTTQFSATQAADAMGFMAMAGMNVDQIMSSMDATLRLAASAQLDMGTAADIVTNVLAGYSMTVDELDHAVDVLAKSFTSANTDLTSLAEAMRYAGPVAASAGLDFEETAAAIALMGNAGIQGSMAGTSLRGAITRLLSPTASAAAEIERLGLRVTDARGRLLPFADIVEQLGPHAEDTAAFMDIFGQRAGPAMAALVSQGSDALRELTSELETSGGTAERIAESQMEGLNGALRLVTSAAEGLGIAIADSGLLEWADQAARRFAALLQRASEMNPALLRTGTIIAGVAAAIGPLLLGLGTLIRLLPLVRTGLLAVRAAALTFTAPLLLITAGVYALYRAWDANLWGMQDRTRAAAAYIGERFRALIRLGRSVIENWGVVAEGWEMILEAMGRIAAAAGEAIRGAFEAMGLRVQLAFAAMFQAVESGMQGAVNFVIDGVNRLVTALNATLGGFGVELQRVERVTLTSWANVTDGIAEGLASAQQRVESAGLQMSIAVGNIQTVVWTVADAIVRGMRDGATEIEAVETAAADLGLTFDEVLDLMTGGFDDLTTMVDTATGSVEGLTEALERLGGAGPRVGALGQSIGAPDQVQAMIDSRVRGRQLEAGGRIQAPRAGVPVPDATTPAVDVELYTRPLAVRMLDAAAETATAALGLPGAARSMAHSGPVVQVPDARSLVHSGPMVNTERITDRMAREAEREARMARSRARAATDARFSDPDAFHQRMVNDPRSGMVAIPTAAIGVTIGEAPTSATPAGPDATRAEAVETVSALAQAREGLLAFGATVLDKIPIIGTIADTLRNGGDLFYGLMNELLFSSQPFRDLLERLTATLQPLVDAIMAPLVAAFETLLNALWPVIQVVLQMIQTALIPLTWILENVVAPVFSFVARLVAAIWNAIARALNVVLRLFGAQLQTIDLDAGIGGATVDDQASATDRATRVDDELRRDRSVEPASFNFGATQPAVQLAVATPLVEASARMLEAADKMAAVFGGIGASDGGLARLPAFGDVLERMTPVLERLLAEGVRIQVATAGAAGGAARTDFLRSGA